MNTIYKIFFPVILVAFLFSCKAKQTAVTPETPKIVAIDSIKGIDFQKVFSEYDKNQFTFKTLNIRANAKYEDEKNMQKVNAEIRIEKDKQILVIIRVFGITFAKALVTPNRVQYYEKTNNTFFDGDFESLSKWLGTDLDYQKVQNLFLGKAFENLNKEQFIINLVDNLYQVNQSKTTADNVNTYYLNQNCLLEKAVLEQRIKERALKIDYSNYEEISGMKFPKNIFIEAAQNQKKTTIDIEYKNISINEDLNFLYNVPEGYEQTFIKN